MHRFAITGAHNSYDHRLFYEAVFFQNTRKQVRGDSIFGITNAPLLPSHFPKRTGFIFLARRISAHVNR